MVNRKRDKLKAIVNQMNGGYDLEVLLEQKSDKTINRLYNQIVVFSNLSK
tara:strand:+ start:403 stop:552 length:150 start_codon:yes stop_codon:yes gene_type:complete